MARKAPAATATLVAAVLVLLVAAHAQTNSGDVGSILSSPAGNVGPLANDVSQQADLSTTVSEINAAISAGNFAEARIIYNSASYLTVSEYALVVLQTACHDFANVGQHDGCVIDEQAAPSPCFLPPPPVVHTSCPIASALPLPPPPPFGALCQCAHMFTQPAPQLVLRS
eukprot:364630-Chlamydomonas_euryale.AAC.5